MTKLYKPLLEALGNGDSIILFPEGTRGHTGEPQPFKAGLYNLACKFPQAVLVPAWINNVQHVLPKGEVIPVPVLCSVTFGAGGSTQEGTFATVAAIQAEGVAAASHFSCIGATKASVREELATLKAMGVKRLVALRGDLPSGYGAGGEFHYASDLVAFIRAETGDDFHIEVAAYPEIHPQAKSPEADLQAFATKVKAGANSAITQYFYNSDAYFRFVDDAYKLGVDVPIVPGIMPITSSSQLLRFSDACGAEIPRWIRLRLQDRKSVV